jgi:diphthamide biosynthesis methyltransferase
MATRNVNADSISYNGNINTISDLRTYIASGNVVRADKTNDLINMINSWDNHTHTYTDYYQQATFGNNGDRTNYEESKTTNRHDEDSSDVGTVSVGDTITAAKHNEMRNVTNKLRAHNHVINDRTSK